MINAILIMSVVGTFIYLALKLLITLFSEQLSESIKYKILIIVMMTFLVPITIFLPPISFDISIPSELIQSNQILEGEANTMSNDVIVSEPSNVSNIITTPETTSLSMKRVFILIYSVGFLMILCNYLIKYTKSNRNLKELIYDNDVIFLNNRTYKIGWIDKKISPFVFGVFNQTIVIPEYLRSYEDLSMILLHEATHIDRKDVVIKNLAQLIQAINWFNPLYILFKKDLYRAMENSCDEKVVSSMTISERKTYGILILEILEATMFPDMEVALGFSNSNNIKGRVEVIMKNKKMNKRIKIFVSIFVLGIICTVFYLSRGFMPLEAETHNESDLINVVTEPVKENTVSEEEANDDQDLETEEVGATVVDSEVEQVESNSDSPSETVEKEEADKTNNVSEVYKESKKESSVKSENVVSKNKASAPSLYWSVIGGEILCEYECYPNHRAIDFAYDSNPESSTGGYGPIYAVGSGKVLQKSYEPAGWGEYIVIVHDNGDQSLYAHLKEESSLNVGERVTKDTIIGQIGMTGRTLSPRVHLEYYVDGEKVNPTSMLIKR